MERLILLVSGLGVGAAVTLALVSTPSEDSAPSTHAALQREVATLAARTAALEATLAARTAALEATVERLSGRRAAPLPHPQGSVHPRSNPAPTLPREAAPREQATRLDPDEAFHRVGARDEYADALELVEELPDLARGWARVISSAYKLDAPATDALLEAVIQAAHEVQPVGRDYLAGRVDREALRARFWAAYGGIEPRLRGTWTDAQLERFTRAQTSALKRFEWLPALVGDHPR